MRTLRPVAWGLALVIATVACGGAIANVEGTAPQPVVESGGAATDGATAPFDPAICDRDNTEDCAVMAFVFDEPLPLDEALAATDDWLALAVFRAEPMCVVGVSFDPSPRERPEVASWFAYVDAEGIQPRVLANPGTPPISGAFINQSYWDHFVAEWQTTKAENAFVTAVVVHTPRSTTVEAAGIPSVVAAIPVDSYRRDASDPKFPGELYIRGHAVPDGFGIDPSASDCN